MPAVRAHPHVRADGQRAGQAMYVVGSPSMQTETAPGRYEAAQ
jgi:hypothetical protein